MTFRTLRTAYEATHSFLKGKRHSILQCLLTTIIGAGALLPLGSVQADTPGCMNAQVLGPKLITDICWSCMFPLKVAGIPLSGGSGGAPSDAADQPVCACDDNLGLPRPGIPMSLWEPARLIEFQRVPGCSSVLNGIRFPFDRTAQGTHGTGTDRPGQLNFMHYHYYAFPLLTILDLFFPSMCNADGYMDLDVMYMSELDPTWANSELAFFTNPEAAAVANPAAYAACAADAVASTSGNPIDSMFWCAGSWGGIYPLSGAIPAERGVLEASSLATAKVLAGLHRRGLAWRTMGDDAMCRGVIDPTLPKSQYKFTLLHPIPETNSSHVMGESTLTWGASRLIPGVASDPIYTIWRWNDCCNTM